MGNVPKFNAEASAYKPMGKYVQTFSRSTDPSAILPAQLSLGQSRVLQESRGAAGIMARSSGIGLVRPPALLGASNLTACVRTPGLTGCVDFDPTPGNLACAIACTVCGTDPGSELCNICLLC